MANAVKNVSNQQVVDALRLLGYPDDILGSPGSIDLSGAQNSTFLRRLLNIGVTGVDFDRAILMAKNLVSEKFDAGGNQADQIIRGLQTRGVPDEVIRRIVADAINSPLNQPQPSSGASITQATPGEQTYEVSSQWTPGSTAIGAGPGAPRKISVAALLDAAGRYNTGATESVRTRMSTTPGVSTPAPPVAQMPAAVPSPAQEEFRAGERAAVNKAPATSMAPASPAAKGAAPGGAGGGAGGGGANNQPSPPATWNDDQIRDFIKQNFGANAYFIDIPEVWNALKTVVKSGKGAAGLEPALETTAFWKQNTVNARSWYVKEKADPAQAAADIAQQTQAIQNTAVQAGVTIDPERAREMAQSYLRYGWTQTDLQHAIGAEWHYDPTSKNQAAAVSKMKQDARNWLVPLSDQAIQTWGQGLMMGTTTDAQFQQYLRDNAKSLLPQLSDLIDAHQTDPNFTVDHFVDPYRTTASQLLGVQPDQIDFTDPKWRRALDQIDPKTNTRRIMSLGEWQSTLKSDPTYKYDKTANGIQDGVNLAQQLKASMGFGG